MKKLTVSLVGLWAAISLFAMICEPGDSVTFMHWFLHECLCAASLWASSKVFNLLSRKGWVKE